MPRYFLVKNTRDETEPYDGPTCTAADVVPGLYYTDRAVAERDAAKLTDHNPVGFHVEVELSVSALLAAREALALALADAIEEIESRFPSDKGEREELAARLRQVIRDNG